MFVMLGYHHKDNFLKEDSLKFGGEENISMRKDRS